MKQARQGDIFFENVQVKDIPTNGKKLTSRTLAYGEVTGHCHAIIEPSFAELESAIGEDGDIFVRSMKEDILVEHDEHGTVTLEKGEWWNVTRQREYDALAKERERRVAD